MGLRALTLNKRPEEFDPILFLIILPLVIRGVIPQKLPLAKEL